MATQDGSQALCGPFLSTDLVSHQAAVEHFESQWRPLLSASAADIVRFIIAMTVRFKRRFRKISIRTMLRGIPPNPAKGFSGICRIRCEKSAAYAAIAELRRIGLTVYDRFERVALDFSKLATDLASDDTLRVNTMKQNRRGGIFSTEDGILKWAMAQVQWLLQPYTANSTDTWQECSSQCEKVSDKASLQEMDSITQPSNKLQGLNNSTEKTNGPIGSTSDQMEASVCGNPQEMPSPALSIWEHRYSGYTRNYRTKYLSGDKSPSRNVREWFMDRLKGLTERILAAANEPRNRLQEKRKEQVTIASRTHLAESAWRRGQIERNDKSMPSRLIPKDRKLVKDFVIRASDGLDFDPADFLYWCALNWDGIGATFFKKAKSYPANPTMPWLIKCSNVYSDAYAQRDGLDLSGLTNPAQRVTAQAVAAISNRAEKAVAAASDTVADLKAQLREARQENERLRRAKALPIDDDPIYAKAAKLAARKITIGSYDEEEAPRPVRRKPARKHK